MIPFKNVLKTLVLTLFRLHYGILFSFLLNKYYLRGLRIKDLQALLPEFYESHLLPSISTEMLSEIEDLCRNNYSIYFISGTLDFIVDYIICKLKAAGGAGSRIEVKNGMITGKLLGTYPIHRGKIIRLNRLLKGQQINWEKSIAYGDSFFDIPLFNLFGNAVAVHPDFVLRKEAVRRGWRIVDRKVKLDNFLNRIWIEKFFRKV